MSDWSNPKLYSLVFKEPVVLLNNDVLRLSWTADDRLICEIIYAGGAVDRLGPNRATLTREEAP